MLIKTLNGDTMPAFTPTEILERRSSFLSKRRSHSDFLMTLDVITGIENIIKVHGFVNYDSAINLAYIATSNLFNAYDFKFGYVYRISSQYIPEYIRDNEEEIHRFLEYVILILIALGWVVSQKEDTDWYYFVFAPLQSLTPEAIELETKQRINQMACIALKTINAGLQSHTEVFYAADLGLPESYHPSDFELIFNRLSELLSPGWTLQPLPGQGFKIKPATPK
ncbi:MAG TPA: hypothetical protein VLH94_01075 [Spirochaetia bacterium]|nr:hypothetical protein [Spirochaetia bacterium]